MASQGTAFTGLVVDIWIPSTDSTDHYDVYLKLSSSSAVMFRVQEANANQEDYLLFQTARNEGTPIHVSGLELSYDEKSYYFRRRTGSRCELITGQISFNLNNNEFRQPLQASKLSLTPPLLYNVAGYFQWIGKEHLQFCPKFQENRRKRYAQISYENSTIPLTVWHTTIDELNSGMASLTYLKPEVYNNQFKLETALITSVS